MAQQSRLDVNKWHAMRRQFEYTPTLWFFYRMVEVAYLDARSTTRAEGPVRPTDAPLMVPTDEALLARDWIARSEPDPNRKSRWFVSFPECCEMLSLKADVERPALLEMIDLAVDVDSDGSWERLESLSAREPEDDDEPLFDAPRVVPALDQLALF